jgi:site-specific DNA recombinase
MDNLDVYLRVSSDSQIEDGFGIQNQKELGIKVSQKLGMKYIEHNEGSKSSNTDFIEERPILNELMFKINNGEVKNLWVFNNDRLSRNENVWNTIRLTLRKNGCHLYVGEGTKYNLESSMDDFIFGIMSEVSKYDNRIRTDRLRRGKLSKIKSGGWRGGPTPFGYKNEKGILKIETYERKWVRKIYEEYSKGKSIYGIRKLLMKNGVMSRRGNVVWSDQSIRKILENTHYEGFYFYKDKKLNEEVRCECQRIIPSSLIKEVRSKLQNSTHKSNYVKHITLLRDFLVCGHCGSKYGQRISDNQNKNHYFCRGNSERHRVIGFEDKVCKTDKTTNGRVRSLHIEDTDDLVWNNVVNVIEKSFLFKEVFKKETMKEVKSFGQIGFDIKGYERRIKQNLKKVDLINDSIKSNKVDQILDGEGKNQFKELIKKFEEKKTEILGENEELNEMVHSKKRSKKWVNWIDKFENKIDDLKSSNWSNEEKRTFLEGVLDKIEVTTKDKHTHILNMVFQSPYVNDILEWNVKGKPKKGYKVIEGDKNLITDIVLKDNRGKSKKN